MGSSNEKERKFSIFDPVVTHKHREFYEQIVNELNIILPVCNHGKSLAVDIGRNAREQDTIKDLMNRVETFRGELLEGTKNLFGQFYLAKEEFYRMILSTMAYGKINTIDRNLLERTCDVRWWALETAFGDCLSSFNTAREQLKKLDALYVPLMDSINKNRIAGLLKKNVSITEEEIAVAMKFRNAFIAGVHVLYSPIMLKEAESILPQIQSICSRAHDENVADLLTRVLADCSKLHAKIDFACDRLEAINRSYTLYRELVLCDLDGNVVATANRARRALVQGLSVKTEEWFSKAMATQSSNHFHETLTKSSVESQDSLIYTTAIRKNGESNAEPIGVLGVFFDFQGEAQIILNDHMARTSSGEIEEGWYSFFTDDKGRILASSDEYMFSSGEKSALPRLHRELKPGQTVSSYITAGGRDSAVFTARSDGYLDYKGLNWNSNLIVLKNTIFDDQSYEVLNDIDINELMSSQITPDINKKTYRYVQKDKRTLQLISTNGILFATELGSRGQALGPVFEQLTKTGDFATKCMEKLLHEMALEELALNFRTLRTFSHQAIDLIDRNLFERAADIRWWATDRYFWEALMHPSEENSKRACERLKVINNSYTMYRNLILANAKGEIIACSNSSQLQRLQSLNVSEHEWFMNGLQTLNSTEFAVQDVQHSELEKNKALSLVYAGGVRKNGQVNSESIGVLGVLFDWDTEAEKMLKCCLPKNRSGEFISGSAAFYTNSSGSVIETTDEENFPAGTLLELPPECLKLAAGESSSGFLVHKGRKYIIGSSRTQGYREYKGLQWSAHVVRPF